MTLQEVLKKAIRKYFEGEEFSETTKAKEGGVKYNKKFFDDFAEKAKEENDGN